MKSKIVVIGSANIDMIIKTEVLPKVGETVGEGLFKRTNGGKGANQAVGAARAGGKVAYIGCLGDDIFAQSMIESLRKDQINTDFVSIEKSSSTGVALIFVDKNGDNMIAVAPGANYQISTEHIDKASELIAEADIIVLQLEIPYEIVQYTVELAHRLGKKILLNPAPARRLGNDVLEKLHIIVLNKLETEVITGFRIEYEEEIETAAKSILSMGPEIVIITLGARGQYIVTKDGLEQKLYGYKVKPVDTTAAGDVFCGTLAVAIAEGNPIIQSVKFASAAAALAVTKLGAQTSAPYKNEIIEFINSYKEDIIARL